MARSTYIYVVRSKGDHTLKLLGTVKHEVHTAVVRQDIEIRHHELVRYRDCGCFIQGILPEVIPWTFEEGDLDP